MPLPNFFIIGAPKCGTTSLAEWLSQHPDVFMPRLKEPHYFSHDLRNRVTSVWREYEALFAGADNAVAIGEASTWYLYSRTAVPAIEAALPGARYILMTRDPSQMALSLFHHNRRALYEDSETFEEAWSLQDERQQGRRVPPACAEPAFLQYRSACSLRSMQERLLDQVATHRVLVLSLERMKVDPGATYRRALTFLDLPDDGRATFPAQNPAREPRLRSVQRVIRTLGRAKRRFGFHGSTGISRLNERRIEKRLPNEPFLAELRQSLGPEAVALCER